MEAGHSPRRAARAPLGPFTAAGEVNHVLLTGRIVADPRRDRGCDGADLTVLLISFDTPAGESHPGCVEVEVPDEVAGSDRADLCAGVDFLMAGSLLRPGVLLATFIHPFTRE